MDHTVVAVIDNVLQVRWVPDELVRQTSNIDTWHIQGIVDGSQPILLSEGYSVEWYSSD